MVEALPALGRFGAGGDGQRLMKLHGHIGSVDHGVLGGARVHREAADGHGGGSGVEVLVLNGAGIAAVHRIGKVGTEARNIEQLCTLADLFIRSKGDTQLAVGQAFFLNGLNSGQNFGNTGLIVGTQQGVPSEVMRVSPFMEVRKGNTEGFITMPVAGRVTSPPL